MVTAKPQLPTYLDTPTSLAHSTPLPRSIFSLSLTLLRAFYPATMRTYRTKVVRNTLEPEWDEVFNFAVTEPSHHLYVEVYDADPMHDSFQGKFNIQLEQLMHRKRVRYKCV